MAKSGIHWKLRVDNLKEDDKLLLRVLDFCEKRKSKCDLIIATKEISDIVKKLHYHIVFHFKEPITYYAFKKSADRSFPELNKSSKSVAKVKKIQTNLIYHCKGGNYIFLHGINKESCESLGSEWIEKKKIKKAKNTFTEIQSMMKPDRSYTRQEISALVFYYYLGKPHNYSYMKYLVDGLYAMSNKDEAYEQFLEYLNILPENKILVDTIIEDLTCLSDIKENEDVLDVAEGKSIILCSKPQSKEN